MKLEVRAADPAALETPLLALPWCVGEPVPEALHELDRRLEGRLARVVGDGGDFRGRKGETSLLYVERAEAGPRRLLLVGLGARDELTNEALRAAAGRAAGRARELRLRELDLWAPEAWLDGALEPGDGGRALAEGLVLGSWHFDALRTEFEDGEPIELERAGILATSAGIDSMTAAGRIGGTLARAQNYARELVTQPANIVTPRYLAERARKLGRDLGFQVTTLDRSAMEEEGMATLLAVASGSDEEPRFIIMEYRAADERPVALIGKGVTFDSGGLSLKTSSGMESMKYDMAGGAAVLGALQAVAALGLRRRVVGLVPAAENLPSGRALKPGDVIRGVAGLSIEIVSTDAEGRLLLSDALAFARRLEPEAMVDLATLTGACVVALGRHAIGLMSNDDELADRILVAGERAGERAWRLPLWPGYRKQLDSEIADIKNSGGREAGAITAGWFLREFAGASPWAHLDIAGTAWAEEASGWQPKGPTGVGVRLLVEWLRASAQPPD